MRGWECCPWEHYLCRRCGFDTSLVGRKEAFPLWADGAVRFFEGGWDKVALLLLLYGRPHVFEMSVLK